MILYKEIGWSTYEPHEDARELFERICDQNKLVEFEEYLEEIEGEFVNEGFVDDLLRFEEPEVVRVLGLDMSEDDADDAEALSMGQWVFLRDDCPKEATCAVVDEDGLAYWYTCDPDEVVVEGNLWVSDNCNLDSFPIPEEFDASDWKNSKVIRQKNDEQNQGH